MFHFRTSIGPSIVHGTGVFAAEFIHAGAMVWRFDEGVDHRISEEYVEALPEPARSTVKRYSGYWGGGYVVSADDARYLNHSENPNLKTLSSPDCDIAIRDILEGEELLEDYLEFDMKFAHKLCLD